MGFSGRVEPLEVGEVPRGPSPRGELVVGYAGTVGVTNALEVYLDAARLLRDEPGVRFRIIGDGALLRDFQQQYADLDSVEWVPKVPKSAVRGELHKCDLLYLSTYPSPGVGVRPVAQQGH